MISHTHRCIFIHIPKCAGTSIENALGHFDGHEGRGGQDHRGIRMLEQPFPTPLAFTGKENIEESLRRIKFPYKSNPNPRNKYTVNKAQYDSYYKFTIVRNPWARAYSWYKNVLRDEIHQQRLGINMQEIDLIEFFRRFVGRGMLRPQTYWLKNFKGEIPMDYVGRFEHLAADFEEVCRRMGKEPIILPHKIKGSTGGYREKFDDASIDLIAKFYQEEIELFGYTFEGEASRDPITLGR